MYDRYNENRGLAEGRASKAIVSESTKTSAPKKQKPASYYETSNTTGEKEMEKPLVVILGNPIDGLTIYGPFDDLGDVLWWMEGADETCWMIELENPGQQLQQGEKK